MCQRAFSMVGNRRTGLVEVIWLVSPIRVMELEITYPERHNMFNQLLTYVLQVDWQWKAVILCGLAFIVVKIGRVVFHIAMTLIAIVRTLFVFAAIALGFYGWNFVQEGKVWWEGAACAVVAVICLMMAGAGRGGSKGVGKPSSNSRNQQRNSGATKDRNSQQQDRYGNTDDDRRGGSEDRRLEPDYRNYGE